ncbi:hypothetical protein RND71_009333 [Anisodus tanguticus]|uniref:Uncharacterized protein n=1 Tax=Anisodus tanguticus TaxID=243964 RepID=A0AAE1SI86_9SOLA|nr:hypothetical protein RND71_009333 [Anisodus tanguticus]
MRSAGTGGVPSWDFEVEGLEFSSRFNGEIYGLFVTVMFCLLGAYSEMKFSRVVFY